MPGIGTITVIASDTGHPEEKVCLYSERNGERLTNDYERITRKRKSVAAENVTSIDTRPDIVEGTVVTVGNNGM